MNKLQLQAKRFYENECKSEPAKRRGILYIHNLPDEFNQEWIATFSDGQFVEINRAKYIL